MSEQTATELENAATTMNNIPRFTVARGDGIGHEIMDATLKLLEAAVPGIEYDTIEVGEQAFLKGHKAGIDPAVWDTLRKNKVFLKAPITTPQGKGYKSLNVTIRKTMGLFANVRPSRAYMPYVHSHFPEMDMVIIRENEEDLYAGIEYQQTPEVLQCLKLVSEPGNEIIIRYAFEYARLNGRKKVTCMSKDNIMKATDGNFHKVFDEVSKEYSDIEANHMIIDIGAARIANQPDKFDVIVTLNLYGDIVSDIAAEVAGSVGMIGTANVGENFAMFEAIHGSAPDIAGQGIANPTGLMNGACMMLAHIGLPEKATEVQNAILKTLEDGIHTGDIYEEGQSARKVSTMEFTDAIIERLGQTPSQLKPANFNTDQGTIQLHRKMVTEREKSLVGVDIYLDWNESERNAQVLGEKLESLSGSNLRLLMINNRGTKVYPNGFPETFCSDHWRCRFVSRHSEAVNEGNDPVDFRDIMSLVNRLSENGLDVIKTENLYFINGKRAYSE